MHRSPALNPAAPGNDAVALSSQIGRSRRAVPEQYR
jgi:hypothetical protein